jgi:hypothetical protein
MPSRAFTFPDHDFHDWTIHRAQFRRQQGRRSLLAVQVLVPYWPVEQSQATNEDFSALITPANPAIL